jgi:cell division protein FtsL
VASWFAESVAAPAPAPAPRTRTRKPKPAPTRPRGRARPQPRARGAILWILVGAILLAGVVFVNLAVLRLNLQLDSATQHRSKLRAENAALQSRLSSSLASPRIQSQARRELGLVPADPGATVYIDLGKP